MRQSWIATLVLLTLGTACSDGGGDLAPAAAIQEFDADLAAESQSRSRLNSAVLARPQESREAARRRLDSSEDDVRLAAVYVLSLTTQPEDVGALAPLLTSQHIRERVLAASAMLSVGDGRAVPILVAALGLQDPLPFGAPPLQAWQLARRALLDFTGQDLGLGQASTAAEAAATAPKWEAWWAAATDSFAVIRRPARFGS